MSLHAPRVVGLLAGDIHRQPGIRTKYGLLFAAVGECFPLVEVQDVSLHGLSRAINAARVVHLDRKRWQERFYQNVPAFRARSRRAAAGVRSVADRADVVLQVGVLFDARWDAAALPSVIYTDYTAALASRNPAAGRSPFSARQRAAWIQLECVAYQRAAHICSRSAIVRESIVTDYGIAPERVSVVGGGVNLELLPEAHRRPDGATPTALFLGAEFYRKGGDLLLRAFARVRAGNPAVRLIVLTADPIPADLPLVGVEVVRPTWDRDAIARLFQRADVFVLPSRLETWGDVVLEAMAYGLPCIGVSGQPMQEIIQDGSTGFLVPAEDEPALACVLGRLLDDAALRRSLGAAGRNRVLSEFTWDRVVARIAPALQAAAAA
jgi:glycosyltransferase involved in cell wall biosynthesis